jgi:hypothetical protein
MSDNAQRTSIQHVAAVKDGIQTLDKDKVLSGLTSLYDTILKDSSQEGYLPLSPFFDLVTTMRYGREDFLSLDIKNLLAPLIRWNK